MARLRQIIEAKERERLVGVLRRVVPDAKVMENWAGILATGIKAEEMKAVELAVLDAGFSRTDVTMGEDGAVQIFIRVKGAADLIEKCMGKGKKRKKR